MIAFDSSTMIAYYGGEGGPDVELAEEALKAGHAVLPPVVVTELLSEPGLPPMLRKQIISLPRIDLNESYWEDAGLLRQKLLSKKLKARLADTLIAAACIQNAIVLVSRDRDYRHFESFGLQLLPRRQ